MSINDIIKRTNQAIDNNTLMSGDYYEIIEYELKEDTK